MKRFLLSIIIVFIISISFFSYGYSEQGNNYNDIIVGYWADRFPVPSVTYGYAFFADNKFLYFDENSYNLKNRYSGSTGKWKIENYKIYIFPEDDYYWKNSWVIDKNTNTYNEGESNKRYSVKSINTWKIIGDIRSYTEDKLYIENNEKIFLKPANLFLKPILIFNGKVLDYEYNTLSYWRLFKNPFDNKDIKDIYDEFNKLAQGNILTSEYAKNYHQYPGGKALTEKEQQEQISEANSLSDEGFSYYKAKKDDLAIAKYEEALTHYASAEIYYRYGNSLSNIPRLEDAVKAYQIAIELNYDKPYLVYYNIACVYSRMNQSKESFANLELAINNGYKNFDHIQQDEDLVWLRSQPEWKDWWTKHKQ